MVIELKHKRSCRAKHFDNSDGTFSAEIHSGDIHYLDKLGSGLFEDIDHTLTYSQSKKSWGFTKHNYHPSFPQYANGRIKFRDLYHSKDRTIEFVPVCDKVKGQIVQGLPGVSSLNVIVYTDAFAPGQDLILVPIRTGFKKIVRIRAGYYDGSVDLTFDFEIRFPAGEKISRTKLKGTDKRLNLINPVNLTPREWTLIGDRANGLEETGTYIKPFVAWDSNDDDKQRKYIDAQIYRKTGKTYLRKIIPAQFLSQCTGDVYTDATTTIYSGANDGMLQNSSYSDWDTSHDATSGAYYSSEIQVGAIQGNTTSIAKIMKSYLVFDTSSIGTGNTVSAATISVYGTSLKDGLPSEAQSYIAVVQPTAAVSDPPVSGDFDLIGDAIDNPTQGTATGDRVDVSAWSITGYNDFVLNSTGYGWISVTGTTTFGLREGHDCEDVTILGKGLGSYQGPLVGGEVSEATGTTQDPKIFITYSSGGATIDVTAVCTNATTTNTPALSVVTGLQAVCTNAVTTNTPIVSIITGLQVTCTNVTVTNLPNLSTATNLQVVCTNSITTNTPILSILSDLQTICTNSVITSTPALSVISDLQAVCSSSVTTNTPTLLVISALQATCSASVATNLPNLSTATNLQSACTNAVTTNLPALSIISNLQATCQPVVVTNTPVLNTTTALYLQAVSQSFSTTNTPNIGIITNLQVSCQPVVVTNSVSLSVITNVQCSCTTNTTTAAISLTNLNNVQAICSNAITTNSPSLSIIDSLSANCIPIVITSSSILHVLYNLQAACDANVVTNSPIFSTGSHDFFLSALSSNVVVTNTPFLTTTAIPDGIDKSLSSVDKSLSVSVIYSMHTIKSSTKIRILTEV